MAVCPVPYEADPEYHDQMLEVIRNHNYFFCDINELLNYEIDIGLSVNYHQIIKEDILRHCKKGFYNVHHSYNLRLRGRNITTHAILNTLDENVFYHGTTLHMMAPELDAGKIIASEAIRIEDTDTSYTLFQKVDRIALQLIKEWIPRIAFESVFPYDPPQEHVHSYKNSELPDRRIHEYMTENQIDALIRAFDFPGKEPAYIQAKENRIHLVFNARDEYQNQFKFKNRIYYTE